MGMTPRGHVVDHIRKLGAASFCRVGMTPPARRSVHIAYVIGSAVLSHPLGAAFRCYYTPYYRFYISQQTPAIEQLRARENACADPILH